MGNDDWDSELPSRDRRRISPEGAAPHRSRKDRKRWCRGKVGVEHTREVRWGSAARWRSAYQSDRPLCEWRCYYQWVRYFDGGRSEPIESTWHWSCVHEVGCSDCGKILDVGLRVECPDYRERRQ